MRPQLEEDRKRRYLVKKYEVKRKYLKILIKNKNLSEENRLEALKKLQQLPRNSAITRVKNRCVISNRSRFIFNKYKISRIIFKQLVSSCEINGVYKKN